MIDNVPFPHLIKDDVLPPGLFSRFAENWPSDAFFSLDYPTADIWGLEFTHERHKHDDAAIAFWTEMETALLVVAEEVSQAFGPLIRARFGFDDVHPKILHSGLLQHGPGFARHGTHTHYYLNPEYVATCLIYVDDAGNSARGTALCADTLAQSTDELAASASRFGAADWDELRRIQPTKIAPFQPNQMLAFYEAPHSWHGVEPYAGEAPVGSRRLLRMGIGVSDDELLRRYGMTSEEFRTSYAGGSDNPEHIARFADDIRRMEAALNSINQAPAESTIPQ
tara:strand:+ start:147629 stop:148471 length:843 start_codon:yes stop_codon:yes gene_type:complete